MVGEPLTRKLPYMSDFSDTVLDGLFLFNQSDAHLRYSLSEFNAYFVFPLLHDKARIFYDGDKPIGLVTWVWLTDDEAQGLLDSTWSPSEETYARDEGDQLWGIEFIAPYGHTRQIMRSMRTLSKELYGDAPVNWRRYYNPNKRHTRRF